MAYHLFHPGNEIFNVIGEYLYHYEKIIITAYWNNVQTIEIQHAIRMCMCRHWEDALTYVLSYNHNPADVVKLAVEGNRQDILMKYVALGWNQYNTGLQIATRNGNLAMMRLFKQLGATDDVMHHAVQVGKVDAAKLCISWGLKHNIGYYMHHIQQCYDPYAMLIFLHQFADRMMLEDPTQFTIMNWPNNHQTKCITYIMEYRLFDFEYTALAVQAATCRNMPGVKRVIQLSIQDIDFNAVLIAATKSNSLGIIRLMYVQGATDTKGALVAATKLKTITLLKTYLD